MEQNIIEELRSKCSINCQKKGECIPTLQLFLDGVACRVEYKYFLDGICNCHTCCEYFKIHDTIKECVQCKSEEKSLPDELQDSVKNMLKNIAKEYKRGY